MTRFRLGVAVLVVAAMVAVPVVAAEPATGSITGPSVVAPGDTVTYTFSVENTGSASSGYIVNVSLPEGWSIVDRSDAGGRWRSDDPRWAFLSIGAGETKEPSLTLSVPGDATDGTVTLGATIEDTDGLRDQSSRTVTVEAAGDGGDGGDDGGDDDSDDGGDEADNDGTTAPTAEAGSVRTVDEGASVSFDGTDSTDDTGIASYAWDFDDNGFFDATGATPSHSYTTPGTYTVTLRVTDTDGNTARDTTRVTVEAGGDGDDGADTTVVDQYDTNDSGTIERGELGVAAADFANGDLSRTDLGIVAANYASS